MQHYLNTSIVFPLPLQEVFGFFADATNLERITPPELNFRILTPLPIVIRQGTLIDYRLRLFGIPFNWQTRIATWKPPFLFIDEQLHGPYKRWEHTHRFEETGGVTCMLDEVRYALPLSPLGEIVGPLVKIQLERIFRFRQEAIQRLLLDC